MEARALIDPAFWNDDAPVMMGSGSAPPRGVPGLVYFRTSGSTGDPKWIGLSRKALQVSAEAVNSHLQVESASCWALALPLEHVGGFGVVARARRAGCRLACFGQRWNAPGFATWLGKERPTHLSLVPTQVHDLVAAGLRAPDSLRAVVVGGGVLAEAAGRAARELGWPVLASYGMTEAGSQVATQGLELLDSPYVERPVGLLPCWDARADDAGRIAIRGKALFSGILGAGLKYEERRGEWHLTADAGFVEGRRVTVTGRIDTVVKILGELVDPVAVENELIACSRGQMDAGAWVVVALEDERAGHRLILVHEAGSPSEVAVRALGAYHARCPGYQRIGEVVGVERIPRSPLGKPRRQELTGILRRRQI